MQYFSRRFSSWLVLAGTALLLIGADNQVKSSGTGSITDSVISGTTNSPISSMTSSPLSSATSSLLSSATGSITSRTTNSLSSSATRSTAPGVVSRPSATKAALSPAAEELAKNIKFDRQVLIIAKGESQDHIGRLIGFDEENYQIIAPGIVISVPEDKTEYLLSSLRRKLLPLKYMAFVVEMNEGLKIDKIGILKGTDQYEILRIMQTNGNDFDISNEDIIDRLKEWETHFAFDIIGAGNDWVEIEFKTLPKDLDDFAGEVYDFCPDAVDEGPGSTFELAKEIHKTKKLFLWWE
jgi:hypothetical protein